MSAALLSQLTKAKNALEDAQITLCGAVTAHAEAKRILSGLKRISFVKALTARTRRNGPLSLGSS